MGYARVNQDILKSVRVLKSDRSTCLRFLPRSWSNPLETARELLEVGYGIHRRRHKCRRRYVPGNHLDAQRTAPLTLAADNTNADAQTREYWVQLANKLKVPIRCVLFTAPPKLCEHNDTVRAMNPGPEVSSLNIDAILAGLLHEHMRYWRRLFDISKGPSTMVPRLLTDYTPMLMRE